MQPPRSLIVGIVALVLCGVGCVEKSTTLLAITPWLRIERSDWQAYLHGHFQECRVERDTPGGDTATAGTACVALALGDDRAVIVEPQSFTILKRDDERPVVVRRRGRVVPSPDGQRIYDIATPWEAPQVVDPLVEVTMYSNAGERLDAWTFRRPPPEQGMTDCQGIDATLFTRSGDLVFVDSASPDMRCAGETVCRLLAGREQGQVLARAVASSDHPCSDVALWPMLPADRQAKDEYHWW